MSVAFASTGLVDAAAKVLNNDLRVSGKRPRLCPGCPFASCVTTTRPVTDVIAEDLGVDVETVMWLRRVLVADGQLTITPIEDPETRTCLCIRVAVSTI
jgi:hypothetical protein